MDKEKSAGYKETLKSTSIFGGVQVLNILIQIIRSKFVALYLGPAGMGVVGLLTSTTGLIGNLTNFGVGMSAVKNVAEADAQIDKTPLARIVKVVLRLSLLTGLLGMVVTIVMAPLLSKFTFDNYEYTLAFILISVTLLINQMVAGNMVVLQGMRQIKPLAIASVIGTLAGTIVAIPVYYFFAEKGIVPVIIFTAFISLLITLIFVKRIKFPIVQIGRDEFKTESWSIMKLGFVIGLSGLLSVGTAYLLRIFIVRTGDLADVGYYNAGFSIINTYVGLVFTAMGTDYFPRLSAVSNDNQKSNSIINQQIEIALLILAPILAVFIVFIHWMVIALYSSQFSPVNPYLHWAALGIFFKATSWALAFIFVAKGEKKLFFKTELIASVYMLLLNLAGYYLDGLRGLGIAFCAGYFVYLLHVYIICQRLFSFSFSAESLGILIKFLTLLVATFLVSKSVSNPYNYIFGSLLILLVSALSFKALDERIGLYAKLKALRK